MGGIANTVGGFLGQTAQAFTPQNSYQYNSGGQNYNNLLAGTQDETAANLANQNSLGQQLLAQSQGQGPNPAQLQLQQALNQNQQNQAGAIASQKGINPGLAQKQIMQNSGDMAQKAAGQGALLGAQQQLAAQNQMGTLYNQIGNQNLVNQGQFEGSLNNSNTTNAGIASANTAATQGTMSGLLGGIGGGAQSLLAKGAGGAGGSSAAAGGLSAGGGEAAGGAGDLALMAAAHGGEIPDMHKMMAMLGHAPGTQPNHPVMMAMKAQGGTVPGTPEVNHNSYQNDKVHAMLTPEEIVLPLSVTKSKDPGAAAKMFVDQIKSKTKKGDGSGYAKVLAAKRKAS